MSILVVAAARPNFMKVAPILAALDKVGADAKLVHTGQHYDHNMSDSMFADLGMRAPDIHLNCSGGSHSETTAAVMLAFDEVVAAHAPDAVVVVGDVDSTLACGLVAAKRRIPLAHVEAGLRSRDRAMPEEINRIVVDAISDWLFTPSPDATENLLLEGVDVNRIHWVGNVMADSLLQTLATLDVPSHIERFGVEQRRYALLTLHRPSNVDDAETLAEIMRGVAEVSHDVPVLFPVHPRTAPQLMLPAIRRVTADCDIRVLPPIGYRDCVALQSAATFVMTDSGGLQEETTVLGVPCLTLRENTERPITVTEGTNTVVGTSAERIVAAATAASAVSGMSRTPPAGWDGHTAERIVDILTRGVPAVTPQRSRPAPQRVAPDTKVAS